MASGSIRHFIKTAGQTVVMLGLVLGLVAFVGNSKDVTLTVDGQSTSVQTLGGTVEEVLAQADVTVNANDQVSPALAASVEDGTAIQVVKARPVEVTLNGAETTVHTTGSTVGDLVTELGVAKSSDISAPFETRLTTLSTSLEISTPKDVALTVDGTTGRYNTTVNSVPELLVEAGITLGKEDRISVPVTSALVDGMGLKVTRVDSDRKKTVTEALPFATEEVEDPQLLTGERQIIRAGVDGERSTVFTLGVVDGKEVSRKLVSDKVSLEPVGQIVAVGTKENDSETEAEPNNEATTEETVPAKQALAKQAPAKPAPAPAGGAWQALAQCESGGNWQINTGNGYYGGLQFSESSWLGAGGGKYAPLPHLASPAEQIATAEVLKQNGGWGHWPSCSAKLGLS